MTKEKKIGIILLSVGIILSIIGLLGVKNNKGNLYHIALAFGLILIGSGGTILVMNNKTIYNKILQSSPNIVQ